MHLFISKGVGVDASSVDDVTTTASGRKQHQQQDRYQQSAHQYQNQQSTQYQSQQSTQYQSQQSTQQYRSQQYNQPPPEQQYYHQRHNQHNQQGLQQQQGQYNHHQTNQSYSFQQKQQLNRPSNIPYRPSQNSPYNQYGDHRLPQPRPTQYYNNPAPAQLRNQPFRANDFQPLTYMPEAVMKQPHKPVRPPTPPKIGWTCPKCTVINEPYRPGCEVCGENRPDNYQPPLGYTPTKDEVKWLQDEVKEKLHFEEVRM